MLNESSTIAAISTAQGIGGIGVVRLSGKDALKIAKKICNIDLTPIPCAVEIAAIVELSLNMAFLF